MIDTGITVPIPSEPGKKSNAASVCSRRTIPILHSFTSPASSHASPT